MALQKMLINIDTLFDTRLACVHLVNREWVTPLLNKGYMSRKTNKLSALHPDIDDKAVDEAWNNRGMGVLSSSFITNLTEELTHRILETVGEDVENPKFSQYEVTINTYPYELSEKDKAALVNEFKLTFLFTEIKTTFKSLQEITPRYLSNNFTQFIIPDLNEWTGFQMNNLKQVPIPHVSCIAPALLLPNKECPEKMEDVIRTIKMIYAAHLDLEILPVELFSIRLMKEDSKKS